jgi:hypothetical protein
MRQLNSSLLPWLTVAAIVGTFTVNVWSNLAPLNGRTIGEISNTQFAGVQITPANYAFAIWGVIYLGLLGFGLYQLWPAQRQNLSLSRARPWLIVACVAQSIWVFCFLAQQFWLSVLAMLAILLSLILVYQRLEIGLPLEFRADNRSVSRAERWLVQVPFGIYLGWISVATITNIALALYNQNWNGWGISPQGWTVMMMGIAASVGVAMILTRREVAFPLVITWALLAIAVKHANTLDIAIPAVVWAVGLAGLALLPWRDRKG